MSKAMKIGLGVVGVGVILAVARCVAPQDPPVPASPIAVEPVSAKPIADAPAAVRTALTLADAIGINEGIALPRGRLDRLTEADEARELHSDAKDIAAIGARLVRANTPAYPFLSHHELERNGWDFGRGDRFFAAADSNDLAVVVVLGPWPGNRTANYTDKYVPDDLPAYQDYVRRVVERYDGDGIDDMPGLRRGALAWEVDNEPDLHNSVQPRGGRRAGNPAEFQTPSEYATVLLATSEAARAASPGATILSAGMYRPHTPNGQKYLAEVLQTPGVLDAIDGVALHCYNDEDSLGAADRTLANARALAPGKGLWITETGVASDGRNPWVDEDWQAGMVAGIVGAFLGGGADRVFWHTLADPPSTAAGDPGPFSSHSLMRTLPGNSADPTSRALKPAGNVLQRLLQIAGATPMATAREVTVSGGRLLETEGGWLAFWGEPEVPAGATRIVDLRTGKETDAGSTARSPAWIMRAPGGTPPG
jgi:hypothetical protein